MRPIDADALGIEKCNPDVFENKAYADGWNAAVAIIENAPTIDAKPVEHGKWVETVFHNGCTFDHDMVCSVCGHSGLSEYGYCPNCGAKMIDESEVEE